MKKVVVLMVTIMLVTQSSHAFMEDLEIYLRNKLDTRMMDKFTYRWNGNEKSVFEVEKPPTYEKEFHDDLQQCFAEKIELDYSQMGYQPKIRKIEFL